jgi:hypothetical protein
MRVRTFLIVLLLAFLPVAQAETMRLTLYDDGLSCPGNCDAHVVFEPALNGTEFAHSPASRNRPFAKCIRGEPCRICLESSDRQCLEVTYRGNGPGAKTFDLTPSFYQKACATEPEQPLLAAKCSELKQAARALDNRTNCIANPDSTGCGALIQRALAAQTQDQPKYQSCITQGEARYNRDKPAAEKRSNHCAYEFKGTGGPNSRGLTWRRLLPGACRANTFVGRDGLDCCSGIPLADGPLGRECAGFYPAP